jgi:flagellar P-ring protein precursor FlgI
VEFIARLERAEIEPDNAAQIIVNERTGTIVMGENVRISTVALAHGDLSIRITEQPNVSQPAPFSKGGTVVTPNTQIDVQEKNGRVIEMPEGESLGDLVRGLNSVGVTPRDLISILQAIKAAGALQADLQIL